MSPSDEITEGAPPDGGRRPSLRRRVDTHVLRWQARLDGEWADRVVPIAAAVGLFLLFAALSLAPLRSLESPLDMAKAVQGTWLLAEGQDPVVTIDGDEHVLARQAALVMYPIGVLARVVPIEPMLAVLQAAALGIAVVPLWRIARRHAHLRAGAVFTLVVVYALYPTLHNLNLTGFHPEVLALPALLGAMYYGLAGRWWPYAACAAFVVLCRADLGLAVAGLGGLLAWRGERRVGAITAVCGIAWTVVAISVLQPQVTEGGTAHVDAFVAYGDTPLGVVWGMITDPLAVLSDLTAEDNFDLFIVLFAPVLFLPVLAPRFLVPVLPLQFLYLVSSVPLEARFGQQTVAITAFIFLSTAIALAGFGRRGVEKITVDGRLLGALVLSGSVFFIGFAASSPYREPWSWGAEDADDIARRELAAEVPDEAAVLASPTVVLLVAQRPEVWALPEDVEVDEVDAGGADALLLDGADHRWSADERERLADDLRSDGFVLVDQRGSTALWVRGEEP